MNIIHIKEIKAIRKDFLQVPSHSPSYEQAAGYYYLRIVLQILISFMYDAPGIINFPTIIYFISIFGKECSKG